MLAQPGPQVFWMIVAVVLGFGVCSLGLQNGVEKITKSHDGLPAAADGGAGCAQRHTAGRGQKASNFILYRISGALWSRAWAMWCTRPWDRPFSRCLWASAPWPFSAATSARSARCSAERQHHAAGYLCGADGGPYHFPACFSFGVNPGQGPGLVFVTLPNIFGGMAGGRVWGALFLCS